MPSSTWACGQGQHSSWDAGQGFGAQATSISKTRLGQNRQYHTRGVPYLSLGADRGSSGSFGEGLEMEEIMCSWEESGLALDLLDEQFKFATRLLMLYKFLMLWAISGGSEASEAWFSASLRLLVLWDTEGDSCLGEGKSVSSSLVKSASESLDFDRILKASLRTEIPYEVTAPGGCL